jgi:small subunit ribosomal protein S11
MEEVKTTEELKKKSAPEEPAEEASKKKKRAKRTLQKGRANIQCTYNNTIVTISDLEGGVLAWSSSGHLGFKGAKKSTPYAATQVVAELAEKVKKYGLQELEVFVKGVGSGREASIRALANNGFNLTVIKDITPIPHNGCRPRRPRRI